MTTFLQIIPIEAPCYAVRLGFANPFHISMTIASAWVWPSSSYSVLTREDGLADKSEQQERFVVPTGDGKPALMYFDNEGAWNPIINAHGQTRYFTVKGDPASQPNKPSSYTIQWSDLVPLTSIPRSDGGKQHLLFVYCTIASDDMCFPLLPANDVINADPLATRGGRHFWTGMASRNGADYAHHPHDVSFKSWRCVPVFAVQYVSAVPGIQLAATGDSLSTAPTNDNFSTPLLRASWELSTEGFPIEYCNFAQAGGQIASWQAITTRNLEAVRPSILAQQPHSRNDGLTAEKQQLDLAAAALLADSAYVKYGTRLIYNMAGVEPSRDGDPIAEAGFVDIRNRVLEIGRISDVPVIDAAGAIGDVASGKPWRYLPGFSDDDTHPNYAGVEALVPQARAALLKAMAPQRFPGMPR
jgi:hypothetical protein